MYHRGPDGRQTAVGELDDRGSRWAMGHQRLAIVDPNSRSANMPFLLQFGQDKIKLAANGEIYNHEKLYDMLVEKHGWKHDRISHSDCEVIGHACSCLGPKEAVKHLDGMFAFVLFQEATPEQPARAFAARDPVGIKPLYYGSTPDGAYVFASELKALVGHVVPSSVTAIPPGHYWTPETGLVRYHRPDWEHHEQPSDEDIREAFRAAVRKRMMADVDYGFFLSGGVDSCIVSHALLPMYREETGDDRPIPAFTVGMEDSPDMMAAKAMVEALGGERYVDHRPRIFTGDHVFDIIPHIIYHMETYEAELIRSAIPNWLLAERAGADVKMVLTGEGADELFAGYLYFMDAKTPNQVQTELKRIYNMLGDINLHRTDRMTMAHSLEARVPFLDTKFTALAMSFDPALKMVNREAVANNAPGREKTFLRQLFEGPNGNGNSIPRAVLWRAKAMQCEGVGEDWVSMLQKEVAVQVTDAEMAVAQQLYPLNTPHTKVSQF
jgi:asparagine synthase (glutamine-hydrolysing)